MDLATLYAAPLIATFLGDLGADVVHVEPTNGDPIRGLGSTRRDVPMVWSFVGRNKRSVCLDLSSLHGIETLAALSAVADVVIVNQPSDVLQRWTCTYADITERNPRAVVVQVSAFGQDGPAARRPGNGTLAEAFGGLAAMIGDPSGPPVLPSVPLGDTLAAWSGALSAVSALYWRDRRSGRGQLVDVALYEPVMSLLATAMVSWTPDQPVPTRTGSRVPGGDPRNCYQTADDRFVVVSGPTDAQVARILDLIGVLDKPTRERFESARERLVHGDELDTRVADWIRIRPLDAVVDAFTGARIPVSAVNDIADLLDDAQVRHRSSVVVTEHEAVGHVSMPACHPRLSATPACVRSSGAALGADTETVLRDWLRRKSDTSEQQGT